MVENAACPHCAAATPPGARFCDNCGQALERACPSCNTLNRAGARFCSQCGTKLAAPAPEPPAEAAVELPLHEGERKHASVLFADVRGSTALIEALDAEQAIAALDPAVQAMVRAVERFGGVVNRRMGDGVMALFGAPLAAEDHALRACLAAHAMVADVQALGDPDIAIRVGISTGDVVIRPTGIDSGDYDAMGVTVHIAARMEQIAEPGTVLLTGATARLAQGSVQLLPLGPIPVKGISQPVEVFRLLSASEQPSWAVRSSANALSPFIGREAELTQLGLALRRARLRRGQAVWVSADAGIGKSRLMHEFLRMLPRDDWQVLRVAATPQATGVPYHLAIQLLRAVSGAAPNTASAEVARRLVEALARHAELGAVDAVPLLALLDQPVADTAVGEQNWSNQDQAARRRRLLAALRQVVLREAVGGPLILLVDDFHWVDQPSIAMLDELVASMGTARMLLLVTTRPERRPEWRNQAAGGEVVPIQLQPLPPGNADALLQDLLGGSDALAPLRARIVAQADGTPLFLEEIARSLIESGLVSDDGEAPQQIGRLTDIVIPASVQAILAARIDRLPAARRRLLQVASVIGKDVPLPLLAAISELSAAQLAGELAELRAAGFLYEIALPNGIEHTFKHALTHAVAYDSLLRRHRRDLHARVLAAMQSLYGERQEELTEQLAGHALRGEVWPEAVRHALAAGDRANSRSAWQEAVAFLEDAVAALDRLERTAESIAHGIEARLKLRAVLAPLADVPRMMRYLDEAGALAQQAGDQVMLARVNISRAAMLAHMGEVAGALTASRAALDTMQAVHDSVGVVGAAFALGQAMWYAGDFSAAAEMLTANLAHVHNERRLQGTMITTGTAAAIYLCCLSAVHVRTGDLAAAVAASQQARDIAEATRRPFDLLACAIYEGPLQLALGNVQAAIDVLEDGLEITRTSDIPVHLPFIARSLGCAYAMAGRLEDAETLLDDASAYAVRHGLDGMRLLCGPVLAMVRVASGDKRALATCQATLEAARATGMRPVEAQAMRALGQLHARRALEAARRDSDQASGALAEAESWFRSAMALADGLGMRPVAAAARGELAGMLHAVGRGPEAAALEAVRDELRRAMGADGCMSYPAPPRRLAPRDAIA